MSRYVESEKIIHAVLFDGSDASALAAVKEIGGELRLSSMDGALALHIGRQEIPPGNWILARNGVVWSASQDVFAETFVAIGDPPVAPAPIFTPAAAPQSPAGFAEGDEVVAPAEPEVGTMTVLEIEDGILICDGPWGEKRFHPSRVRRADAAA